MPFALASPWLLFALTALAVPVLVHLVHRRERGGLAFPSLMFIRRMPFQARRRKTLRNPLLLALRCLALALVVVAFTGPERVRAPTAGAAAGFVRDTVLVLDRSYSMSPAARWQAAVDAAGAEIDALAGNERMAIVAFDETAVLAAGLTGDRAALHAAVSRLSPSTGGTRPAAALGLAERVLRESEAGEPAVVMISDFQRSVLARLDRLYLDTPIAFDARPVTAPVTANAAILGARLVASTDVGNPDTLAVRVRNTGTGALSGVGVALETDGRLRTRRTVDLAPGEERIVRMPVVAAADRQIAARILLDADDLPADDIHHLVITPTPPLRVGLLRGMAAAPAGPDPAVYIERALAAATDPPITVTAWPEAPAGGTTPTIEVLIAGDPALSDTGTRQRVAQFVERGGALLLMMADTGSAQRSPASDSPLVPESLGPIHRHPPPGAGIMLEPGWPAASRPQADTELAGALSGARFRLSRQVAATNGAGDRVLARLETGEPWLVEHAHGRGRSVVMTAGHTAPWSDLALDPGFVPLLHELVHHLARRPDVSLAHTPGDVVDLRRLARRLPNGADWTRFLDEGGAAVVEPPGGGQTTLPPGEHLLRVGASGFHEIHRGDGAAPSLTLAVNTDRRESLLAAAGPEAFTERIARRALPAGDIPAGARIAADQAPTPLGWYLLAAAVALLLLESLAANRLTQRRPTEPRPPGRRTTTP